LGISQGYLSTAFKKQTGESFTGFVSAVKIEKAKELIAKNPEEPIKNVAEQVGCGNNPQYFSQLFKKQTGMTPTDYITSLGH
jgi:two-component system response regulator YesN